ncbi:PepSY domain-containing protein [Streptomyces sp. AcE210]|uniref:PepSY domain-containing protein n=1 Tax=Streptomyces sp. AcE210 TaxID=2292703 RepID=UPI000E307351|nr:PepSY domain-containing protein [Streptomyces sp. AcE210]RFC78092.1 peptidase M4 [Streptomyces sp. AcE210]
MRCESRRKKPGIPRARHLHVVGAVCAVVASAALMTGCGKDGGKTSAAATAQAAEVVPNQAATPSESPSGSAQLTQDQTERKKLLGVTKVTFDKAAATAVGEVSGSKLAELDLKGLDDNDNDTDESESPSPSGTPSPSPSGSSTAPEWVAEVVEKDGTTHTVRIDAVSGKVIQSVAETGQDSGDKREMADRIARVTQTPQEAAKVATDKQEGTVTSINLDDNDNNALIWSVDVVTKDWNKTDFEIDAVKGTITREEVDHD